MSENKFSKVRSEVSKPKNIQDSAYIPQKRKRETKEQMSITLTPTDKKRLRKLADSAGMSASELIGYWINL